MRIGCTSYSGPARSAGALAAHLAGLGIAVRAVSRHRPPALAGVDRRAADAADPEAAADAAKGAAVIYQRRTRRIELQWPRTLSLSSRKRGARRPPPSAPARCW